MNLLTIPRLALDGYLKVVKWPLSQAAGLLGRNGATNGAEIALDRVDASVRTVAGAVLDDEQLQQDGAQRRTAADERERALKLRATAEKISERSEDQLSERTQKAEQQRKQATKTAAQRKQAAEKAKTERERKAAKTASKRKAASAKAAAKVEESIEERAKRERLEAIEHKAKAIDDKTDALTAADEAQRLAEAAAAAKAERKGS